MKSFLKIFTERLSPIYRWAMLLKDKAYWSSVFVMTFIHYPTAEKLALRWFDRLREKIISKHKTEPESLIHPDKQPEDNLTLMLALIERYKNESKNHVRSVAWVHVKGNGLILERKLEWVDPKKAINLKSIKI